MHMAARSGRIKAMGQQFEFDLVFGLPRKDLNQDAILDALFEAGCEDAVVWLSPEAVIALKRLLQWRRKPRNLRCQRAPS